jgi:hypothetical protein
VIPRTLRRQAAARKQAARMNELAQVIQNETVRGPEHRDGYTVTERSWQPEAFELRTGFQPE